MAAAAAAPAAAHSHQPAAASTPAAAAAADQQPSHLIVLVNGLWGWQRDWARTAARLRALDAEAAGACLVHVSAVNVGAGTYDGVDACGARLAREILALVAEPQHAASLTTISLVGHSMGGLIARWAVGLLADPVRGRVAGLTPGWFVSIASPHLGCSSSHPHEVHWQDRPWMRLLAAAVAAGHLGGHEHLAPPPPTSSHNSHNSQQQQQEARAFQQLEEQQQQGRTSGQRPARGIISWAWSPCRSVVQLLGCDAWQPPPDGSSCSTTDGAGAAGIPGCCPSNNSSAQADQGHHWTLSSSSRPTSSTGGAAPSLLDCLAADVQLSCCRCGARRVLPFLSGLHLFSERASISSAGGDHLVPWTSSSLLLPRQLPVRSAASTAAAGGDAGGGQADAVLTLPTLGLLATQPAIVEQPAPPQQQPARPAPTTAGSSSSQPDDDDASTQPVAPPGVLAARLARLQAMHWRRFHVVWPPLCLGSSHCNIQHNGPLNFVGAAVVDHVARLLLGAQEAEQEESPARSQQREGAVACVPAA